MAPKGTGVRVSVVVGDVATLHVDPEYRGATFQVRSTLHTSLIKRRIRNKHARRHIPGARPYTLIDLILDQKVIRKKRRHATSFRIPVAGTHTLDPQKSQ